MSRGPPAGRGRALGAGSPLRPCWRRRRCGGSTGAGLRLVSRRPTAGPRSRSSTPPAPSSRCAGPRAQASGGAATAQALERTSMDLQQVQALIAVQFERIGDYTITAPMDGILLRRDGEVGEIAEAGQVLVRVGVPKPLQIVAEVNEEDIPRVAVGQTVLLRTDAFAGQRLEGRVREITPMGDPVAKTYRIRVALPDDTPLLPGMSVEANVITREK